jgi:hypothetical protein
LVRAELRSIEPNDFLGWQAFAAAPHEEPWDDFGWFMLGIGPLGEEGSDLFQVLVTTPAAIPRLEADKRRRMFIVDSFEPDSLAHTLRDYVASISGLSWMDIVRQLQRTMHWEYEEMRP